MWRANFFFNLHAILTFKEPCKQKLISTTTSWWGIIFWPCFSKGTKIPEFFLTYKTKILYNIHLVSIKLRIALMISSTEPKLSTSESSFDVSAVMVALLSMLNVDFVIYWVCGSTEGISAGNKDTLSCHLKFSYDNQITKSLRCIWTTKCRKMEAQQKTN